MKKLPEVNVSFEDLYRMLIAPIQSLLLLAGIELKVSNHLTEPRSADAVARAIGSGDVVESSCPMLKSQRFWIFIQNLIFVGEVICIPNKQLT